MAHIIGVELPESYAAAEDSELKSLERQLVKIKRGKAREMDHIDTELVGIREELRKRKEKKSIERTFPSSCTKG